MKKNDNGHALRNLTNRVMAVIDDQQNTEAAVETLERAGIADRELATLKERKASDRSTPKAFIQRRQTRLAGPATLDCGRPSPSPVSGGDRQRSSRRRCLCSRPPPA